MLCNVIEEQLRGLKRWLNPSLKCLSVLCIITLVSACKAEPECVYADDWGQFERKSFYVPANKEFTYTGMDFATNQPVYMKISGGVDICPGEGTVTTYPALEEWQDSGIEVREGEPFELFVTGSYSDLSGNEYNQGRGLYALILPFGDDPNTNGMNDRMWWPDAPTGDPLMARDQAADEDYDPNNDPYNPPGMQFFHLFDNGILGDDEDGFKGSAKVSGKVWLKYARNAADRPPQLRGVNDLFNPFNGEYKWSSKCERCRRLSISCTALVGVPIVGQAVCASLAGACHKHLKPSLLIPGGALVIPRLEVLGDRCHVDRWDKEAYDGSEGGAANSGGYVVSAKKSCPGINGRYLGYVIDDVATTSEPLYQYPNGERCNPQTSDFAPCPPGPAGTCLEGQCYLEDENGNFDCRYRGECRPVLNDVGQPARVANYLPQTAVTGGLLNLVPLDPEWGGNVTPRGEYGEDFSAIGGRAWATSPNIETTPRAGRMWFTIIDNKVHHTHAFSRHPNNDVAGIFASGNRCEAADGCMVRPPLTLPGPLPAHYVSSFEGTAQCSTNYVPNQDEDPYPDGYEECVKPENCQYPLGCRQEGDPELNLYTNSDATPAAPDPGYDIIASSISQISGTNDVNVTENLPGPGVGFSANGFAEGEWFCIQLQETTYDDLGNQIIVNPIHLAQDAVISLNITDNPRTQIEVDIAGESDWVEINSVIEVRTLVNPELGALATPVGGTLLGSYTVPEGSLSSLAVDIAIKEDTGNVPICFVKTYSIDPSDFGEIVYADPLATPPLLPPPSAGQTDETTLENIRVLTDKVQCVGQEDCEDQYQVPWGVLYDDNIGRYKVDVVTTDFGRSGLSSFLNRLTNIFKDFFLGDPGDPTDEGIAETMYKDLIDNALGDNGFVNGVRALLVLFIAVYGFMFMLGMIQDAKTDMSHTVIRVAIVVAAISPGSWEFFYSVLFQAIIEGMDNMIALVAADFMGSNITGDVNPIISDGTGIATNTGVALVEADGTTPVTISADRETNPFAFIDSTLGMMFSQEARIKVWGLLFASPIGFLYVIAIIWGFYIYIFAILKAMILYILAMVVLAFLIGLAPLFIMFMLFSRTRDIFDGWVKQLINFFFQPVMVFTGLAIFNVFVVSVLYLLLHYTVCLKCVVQINLIFTEVCLFGWYMPVDGTSFSSIPVAFSMIIIFIIVANSMLKMSDWMAKMSAEITSGVASTSLSKQAESTMKIGSAWMNNVANIASLGMYGKSKDAMKKQRNNIMNFIDRKRDQ